MPPSKSKGTSAIVTNGICLRGPKGSRLPITYFYVYVDVDHSPTTVGKCRPDVCQGPNRSPRSPIPIPMAWSQWKSLVTQRPRRSVSNFQWRSVKENGAWHCGQERIAPTIYSLAGRGWIA